MVREDEETFRDHPSPRVMEVRHQYMVHHRWARQVARVPLETALEDGLR